MEDRYLSGQDGTQIYYQEWKISEPKAYVVLVHGLGEHIGRYQHVAQYWNKHQMSVVGYDHQGHGKSSGKRGVIRHYASLLDHLEQVLEFVKLQAVDLPGFIYAHSMGGNIALNFLLRRKPKIAGMICTGAAIKLAFEPSPVLVALGKIARKIYPAFAQNNQLIVEHISRNEAVVTAYKNDPLVHNQVGAELGLSLLESGKWLLQNHGPTPCPLLLMHGQDDQITDPEGSIRLGQNLTGDVTVKIWPTLYHEIHNEPEQMDVLAYTWNWIEERL